MSEINWTEINNKLPTGKDPESKTRRLKLFRAFDNGNGVLSLQEVDKAIRDVLEIDEIFNAKPAIKRAFEIAKNKFPSQRSHGDDYIELREFKFFLLSLRQYFEYWVAFCRADTSGDHRISLDEFLSVREKIELWVGEIGDMEAEFKAIDKDGSGTIAFDEFCDWAIMKNLDLEDDDDDIAQ